MFKFNAQFKGVPAFGAFRGDPPEGVYMAEYANKLEVVNSKTVPGYQNAVATFAIVDEENPEANGWEFKRYMPIPCGKNPDKDRTYLGMWKGLLASAGYDDEALDADFELDDTIFDGMSIYVYVQPRRELSLAEKDKGTKAFAEVQVITQAQFEDYNAGSWRPFVKAPKAVADTPVPAPTPQATRPRGRDVAVQPAAAPVQQALPVAEPTEAPRPTPPVGRPVPRARAGLDRLTR